MAAEWAAALEAGLFFNDDESADERACYAAFIGDEQTGIVSCVQKGVPYADEGGPWPESFADPSEREILDENGDPQKVHVDETAIYWEIQQCLSQKKEVRTGKFPNGIWLGGRKYTVTREDFTEGDAPLKYVNMALKGEAKAGAGGGLTIVYAKKEGEDGYLLCVFFKKPENDPGACNQKATKYAQTLVE